MQQHFRVVRAAHPEAIMTFPKENACHAIKTAKLALPHRNTIVSHVLKGS